MKDSLQLEQDVVELSEICSLLRKQIPHLNDTQNHLLLLRNHLFQESKRKSEINISEDTSNELLKKGQKVLFKVKRKKGNNKTTLQQKCEITSLEESISKIHSEQHSPVHSDNQLNNEEIFLQTQENKDFERQFYDESPNDIENKDKSESITKIEHLQDQEKTIQYPRLSSSSNLLKSDQIQSFKFSQNQNVFMNEPEDYFQSAQQNKSLSLRSFPEINSLNQEKSSRNKEWNKFERNKNSCNFFINSQDYESSSNSFLNKSDVQNLKQNERNFSSSSDMQIDMNFNKSFQRNCCCQCEHQSCHCQIYNCLNCPVNSFTFQNEENPSWKKLIISSQIDSLNTSPPQNTTHNFFKQSSCQCLKKKVHELSRNKESQAEKSDHQLKNMITVNHFPITKKKLINKMCNGQIRQFQNQESVYEEENDNNKEYQEININPQFKSEAVSKLQNLINMINQDIQFLTLKSRKQQYPSVIFVQGSKKYQCQICKKIFDSRFKLGGHKSRSHPNAPCQRTDREKKKSILINSLQKSSVKKDFSFLQAIINSKDIEGKLKSLQSSSNIHFGEISEEENKQSSL